MKTYVIHMVHSCLNFRKAELDALREMLHLNLTYEVKDETPFCLVHADSVDSVVRFVSRSVLSRYAFEVWAMSVCYADLLSQLRAKLQDYKEYFRGQRSYKFSVESFGRTLDQKYKVRRIEEFSFMPLEGPVKMRNPDIEFCLVEQYNSLRGEPSESPALIYFGTSIGQGSCRMPSLYNLKRRKYIGNTSMDPLMSFLMNNIGKVGPNDLVYDPFVGTGSILLPAAHFGAKCFGADIDYNSIHGLGKSSRCNVRYRSHDEKIKENFRQYGLEDQYMDMIIADTSRTGWIRPDMVFDCIVTDPPYGLREKIVRVGTDKASDRNRTAGEVHFPKKTRYQLKDVFLDLLSFAARHLVVNGRLVYWLPFDASDFNEMLIPRHPCLAPVVTCEQLLGNSYGRVLIAMEKMRQPETTEKAYFINEFYSSFRDRVLKCHLK